MGTHEELMELNEKYATMIRLQNVAIDRVEKKDIEEEVIEYA